MNLKRGIVFVGMLVGIVLPLSFGSTRLMAQPGPPGPGIGPLGGMLRGLDLTDDQRTRIRAIVEEGRDRDKMQQLHELHQQLTAAIYADTPDRAQIDALQSQIAALQNTLAAERIALQLRIAQVLTAEQRAKLREARAEDGGPRGPRGRGRFQRPQ